MSILSIVIVVGVIRISGVVKEDWLLEFLKGPSRGPVPETAPRGPRMDLAYNILF